MKTLFRWLISALLAVGVLGLSLVSIVLILFFFNREWQLRMVDGFLEHSTGWQWDIETLDLGWNRIQAEQIFVLQGGNGFEVRQVEFNLRPITLLRQSPVEIQSGSLTGLMVDLSQLPTVTLGMSPQELAALPEGTDASLAVERMVLMSMERLQNSGIHLQASDVQLEGIILLPAQRMIAFEALIECADSRELDALDIAVFSASLR